MSLYSKATVRSHVQREKPGLRDWEGYLYGEVQCIMGNGHMVTPPSSVHGDSGTTEPHTVGKRAVCILLQCFLVYTTDRNRVTLRTFS